MYIANKVVDNMEILQEKKLGEFSENVEKMLSAADLEECFTTAEFKHFLDPLNPDNMLTDLTHKFIHRAVEIGLEQKGAERKSTLQPKDAPVLATKESQRSSAKTKKKWRGSSLNNTLESQRNSCSVGSVRKGVDFKPNLGIDMRGVKSLYDLRDREVLFHKVQFVLEHIDKERFIAFRSGKLSMPQCIARIEAESKGGLSYKVLDDLSHDLDPECLKKPSFAVSKAYQEQVIEERLLRGAKKRGIDPVILTKTSRNLNLDERCVKSIFTRPKTVNGCSTLIAEKKQNFKVK